MVTSKLFRLYQNTGDALPKETGAHQARTIRENRIAELEEHLAHLTQQKDLHTLALKEMYQFLCKLDANFREENQKLRTMIKAEQERSSQLIEVTKGLWEIIEIMDNNNEEATRLINLTQNVEELSQYEVEVTDESENQSLDRTFIDKLMPMVEAS